MPVFDQTEKSNQVHDKLSREIRNHIRNLYSEGILSQREIARICGISQMQVSRIVRGEAWAREYEEWMNSHMPRSEEVMTM